MSRKNQQQNPTQDEDDLSGFVNQKKKSGITALLTYLPFAFLTSIVSIILYVTVRGLDVQADIPYVAVGYAVSVVGLTLAYRNVAEWVKFQRAKQIRNVDIGTEGLWLSLFYNNAFYIFLLFFFSHIVFSSFPASSSFLLTQLIASFLPVWVSSLAKKK